MRGLLSSADPPAEEIEIAAHPHVPTGMPPIAWHQCTWNAFPFWFTKGAPVNKTVAQHARRAYYAATSFADHLVGRVLDTMDELGVTDKTITMLVGDHGWQLGEHNGECKQPSSCTFNFWNFSRLTLCAGYHHAQSGENRRSSRSPRVSPT